MNLIRKGHRACLEWPRSPRTLVMRNRIGSALERPDAQNGRIGRWDGPEKL